MKKTIAVLLAGGILAGGGILFANDPSLRYQAASCIKSVFAEKPELEKAECAVVSVPVSELGEYAEVNGCLRLVNTEHTLPEDFQPELFYYNEVPFELRTAAAYKELSKAVNDRFGERIYVSSTYRTAQEQAEIYAEQGPETAQQPGASEHQTGLAIDVYVQNFAGKGFIKCEAGQWVNDHCQDYGFIIRYPSGKSGITGISYEPWHLRYVGEPHAKIISESGIALEEYAGLLGDGFRSYEGWLISHQTGGTVDIPQGVSGVTVSPDGCGGWFVTAKRFTQNIPD